MTETISNRLLFYFALAVIAILSFSIQSHGQLNPDVSWINYGLTRMLGGATLYRDLIEINPPLIYVLSLPPIWFAKTFGQDAAGPFILWAIFLAIASLALAFEILSSVTSQKRFNASGVVSISAAASLLLIGKSFAQREMFIFVFLLPYVSAMIARMENAQPHRWLLLLSGALAAVAVALKPHYAGVIVALEGLYIFHASPSLRGVFRTENTVFAATSILLWGALLILFPDFAADIVPMGARAYVPYYRTGFAAFVQLTGVFFGLLAIFYMGERFRGLTKQSLVFLTAAAASLIAVALQFRGFDYHYLPEVFFLMALAGSRLASLAKPLVIWGVVSLVIAVRVLTLVNPVTPYDDTAGNMFKQWAKGKQGKTIAILTTDLGMVFPWVPANHMVWSLRYPSLWFISFLDAIDHQVDTGTATSDQDRALATRFRNEIVEDLVTRQPEYLFVQTIPTPMLGKDLDFLSTLGRDHRFPNLMAQYNIEAQGEVFTIYAKKLP